MEYLQLFNENKKKLDEKVNRKDKSNLPEGKYFMIVLVFIENGEGKFLLQKTSKSRNSCIATTGGHVTFKDDGLYTAFKEVKEELSIEIIQEELKYVDTITYKNCHLEIYYVKKNININQIKVQEKEVEYVNWYSIDEINKLIDQGEFRESNIIPFKKVLKYKKI